MSAVGAAADLIGGVWRPIPGEEMTRADPCAPGRVVYSCSPQASHVDDAVAAARAAAGPWARLTRERRFAVLRRYAEIAKAGVEAMAGVIADEVGKVMWESRAEAANLAAKVEITLDDTSLGGMRRVSDQEAPLSATRLGQTRFMPHGVFAVVGPFNFPAHLPNGHIVPALAMGNTVVFKPSDKAPGVGQLLGGWFDRAVRDVLGGDYIAGVVNVVQGRADVASRLVGHDGIDAIAFTGSWPVAKKIMQANADRPGRLIALELGGSNPLVVLPDADLRAAAIEAIRCSFTTTGQRCTCTRRIIVHEAVGDRLVAALVAGARALTIGPARAAGKVFCGPLASEEGRRGVLDFQSRAAAGGGRVVLEARELALPGGGWFISPGVMEVGRFRAEAASAPGPIDPGCDEEVFGPLVRVARVRSLEEAIEQANATRYGLAASIFSASERDAEEFVTRCRAGCINVNTGTAGASSKLPFGGLGLSGNHRPAGSFALDFCAYPVAAMVERSAASGAAIPEGMSFDDAWVG